MTADEALRRLNNALADLDDAERRFAGVRAAGRQAGARKGLSPKVADIAGRDDAPMREAMTDWSTAHTRIQSYAAAATALLLAESAQRAIRRAA
jgi:hypothetical protein